MVEGGMACVKYLLFAFNFLFFLIGLILIIAGAVIQIQFRDYFEVIAGEFSAVAGLLIAVGVIILVIGFFGCCGAWKENSCMVLTFAGLLTLIFVLELAAGIAGFALRGRVEHVVGQGLNESLAQYSNSTADQDLWNSLQSDLRCCGVNGYADWEGKLGSQAYPKSCCKPDDKQKPGCGTASGLAYKDGCLTALGNFVDSNLVLIGIVGLIVAIVEIVGITFACCLTRAIKKEYESV